ncbi:NgoMIV family type II restriction endonuclease [Pseudooceanicola sp.]|uniref:NgoMIV family type II restriction endonuclease n=1 Tax=Pseudooceanicola sp. TaxID=1914328 RepID=UPI0035C6A911
MTSKLRRLREAYHAALLQQTLTVSANGTASNADSSSKPSKHIADGILTRLGTARVGEKIAGQTAGSSFEQLTADFVAAALAEFAHIRPGRFTVQKGGFIAGFQQYAHLDDLERIARQSKEIATALGSDYLIKPDVVVYRYPLLDTEINANGPLVDLDTAQLSGLRQVNDPAPILHASISCKWTLRSDRAQNARSEGLNLVRNRKGSLCHVTVVTAEPLPSRLASLALGTGDIDCVYHFALEELRDVLRAPGLEGYSDTLEMMIDGQRLRDIADLPLDIVI